MARMSTRYASHYRRGMVGPTTDPSDLDQLLTIAAGTRTRRLAAVGARVGAARAGGTDGGTQARAAAAP
jgi:hypothetical protein